MPRHWTVESPLKSRIRNDNTSKKRNLARRFFQADRSVSQNLLRNRRKASKIGRPVHRPQGTGFSILATETHTAACAGRPLARLPRLMVSGGSGRRFGRPYRRRAARVPRGLRAAGAAACAGSFDDEGGTVSAPRCTPVTAVRSRPCPSAREPQSIATLWRPPGMPRAGNADWRSPKALTGRAAHQFHESRGRPLSPARSRSILPSKPGAPAPPRV